MDKKQAIEITGGLTRTTKMPCASYSLPTTTCNTGGKFRKIPGSVCYKCYACKGNYRFSNVKKAQARRLLSLKNPDWVAAMAFLINDTGLPFFRWHDSGDIIDMGHLAKIVEVCLLTPKVKHYLPTKEYSLFNNLPSHYVIPDNLSIRLSSPMLDMRLKSAYNTSVVVTSMKKDICKATLPEGDHMCGDCRRCWDRKIKNINYYKH